MRALKLIGHMKANAEGIAEAVNEKIRSSDRCSTLVQSVLPSEQKRDCLQIYQDLSTWLEAQSESTMEPHYIALGMRRATQRVPFSELYWAVCIAHEHLWEYMQEECLIEEPVEFWGGVMLLRSLTRFFERCVYFAMVGYEKIGCTDATSAHAGVARTRRDGTYG